MALQETDGARVAAGLALATLVALVAALMLGEYEFSGATPFGAAVVLALVISEVIVEVGGQRRPWLGVVAGALCAGSIGLAAWISSGQGLRPFPTVAWLSMALGAGIAGMRAGGRARRRDDPPAAAPEQVS